MDNYDLQHSISALIPYLEKYGKFQDDFIGDCVSTLDQTKNLHLEENMYNIVNFIDICIKDFWKDLKYKGDPFIYQMWINKYGKGGAAEIHQHNIDLESVSGAFYAYMDCDEMGNLYIVDENIREDIIVRTGDLILFPSSLKHGTYSNKTNRIRLCISFDAESKNNIVLKRMTRK